MLEVKNLKKSFPIGGFFKSQKVEILNEVSFSIAKGKTMGLVGESGCGKSTIAKILCGLDDPTSGEILFEGENVLTASSEKRRHWIQMVFQDPYNSLNPRQKAWEIISAPLIVNEKISMASAKSAAIELMEKVGLRSDLANNYSHQFSGGQRQRLGIARALTLRPRLLILDEPVSALDVSIQSQVLNLLMDLQKEFSLSYLLISHDLDVIKHLSDDIMVMYLGQIVEKGPSSILNSGGSQHPYTELLMQSTPAFSEQDSALKNSAYLNRSNTSEIPSVFSIPRGCRFHTRCPKCFEKCRVEEPVLIKKAQSISKCWL